MKSLQSDGEPLQQSEKVAVKTCWGTVTAAVIATFAAVTPGFTVGALTGPITKEFGVSTPVLDTLLACFFAFTAIGSPISARLAERIPLALQLTIATLMAGIVMIGIGQVSLIRSCTLLLVIGGLANSLVQPAVGRILNSGVSKRRLSLASGLVQAASGAGTLPAFLLLRYLADPYGWRVAFTVGGALALLSAIIVYLLAHCNGINVMLEEPGIVRKTAGHISSNSRALRCWVLGASLGTVGVTGISSFFITITTYQGFSVSIAGSLALAVSGLAAVVRIVAGYIADKRPNASIVIVTGMMVMGTVGLGMDSLRTPELFLIGMFVVVIGLFGWNGLLVAASIRLLPGGSAKILGWLQVGFFTGATVAPMIFGILINAVGVRGTLLTAAVCAIAGVSVILLGEIFRRADQSRTRFRTP